VWKKEVIKRNGLMCQMLGDQIFVFSYFLKKFVDCCKYVKNTFWGVLNSWQFSPKKYGHPPPKDKFSLKFFAVLTKDFYLIKYMYLILLDKSTLIFLIFQFPPLDKFIAHSPTLPNIISDK
jgi:hypothetical protein